MNFTQNEKLNQVTTKTLVIGVDIGSETHYARAFDWRDWNSARYFDSPIVETVLGNFTRGQKAWQERL